MSAVELLLYWVAPVMAIVYVVGYSLLFEGVRKWAKWPALVRGLLDCPMCIGWWAGMFVGLVNWVPVHWPAWSQNMAIGGCLAIAVQYILEVFGRE